MTIYRCRIAKKVVLPIWHLYFQRACKEWVIDAELLDGTAAEEDPNCDVEPENMCCVSVSISIIAGFTGLASADTGASVDTTFDIEGLFDGESCMHARAICITFNTCSASNLPSSLGSTISNPAFL